MLQGSPVIAADNMPAVGADFGDRFQNLVSMLANGEAGSVRDVEVARESSNRSRLDSVLAQFKTQSPEVAKRIDSAVKRLEQIAAARPNRGQKRRDAFSVSAGFHMARQLEYMYADVLREPYPVPSAFTLFPTDSTVPPGARYHTVRRIYRHGEAAIYRGGQAGIPRVGVSQREEQFPVRHIVSSFVYSLFEQLSSQFANTNLVQEDLRACRDIVMEYANQLYWHGSIVNGLMGVLNYKWLSVKVVATKFDGTAAADDVIRELSALANYARIVSKTAMSPNTVAVSPAIKAFLMGTPRSSTTDTSIGKWWLENNAAGIKSIEEAWELAGAGPGGTDGILFYLRDRRGIVLVMPQPFTTLPVQSLGFEDSTYAYMSTGGVVMREAGANTLGWVDVTP